MAAVENDEENSNDSKEDGERNYVTADLRNVLLLSMEQESLEQHVEQLRQLIDDEDVTADYLIHILSGDVKIEENADEVDGVPSTNSRVGNVQNDFNNDTLRAKNAHWLLLSCPTSAMEEEQREHEINHFVKSFNLPDHKHEKIHLNDEGGLYENTQQFLKRHSGTHYHLNIVILGHGSARHGTVACRKTGILTARSVHGTKVHVDCNSLVAKVESLVDLCKETKANGDRETRQGHIHLCLFHCFAQHSKYDDETGDLRVILYKNGEKNPASMVRESVDGKHVISAMHLGLNWLMREWMKMEQGETHSLTHGVSAAAKLMNQGQDKGTQTEDVMFAPAHPMNQGQSKGMQAEDVVYAPEPSAGVMVQSEANLASDDMSKGASAGPAEVSLSLRHLSAGGRTFHELPVIPVCAAVDSSARQDTSAGIVAVDAKWDFTDRPNLDCSKSTYSSFRWWRRPLYWYSHLGDDAEGGISDDPMRNMDYEKLSYSWMPW